MPSEIAAKIARALRERERNRDAVGDLHERWTTLREQVEQMRRSVVAARESVSALPDPSGAQLAALRELDQVAGGELRQLEGDLLAMSTRLGSVRSRVERQTVNIGVIGETKAGKSTLLRGISDLPPTVIPSSKDNPTTAARSRIYHRPGENKAIVKLRTWESFRDRYLAPLHRDAGLADVPATPKDFRRRNYPSPQEFRVKPGSAGSDVSVQPFLRKLHQAKNSLDSYLPLLRSTSVEIPLTDLAQFVAYPLLDTDTRRPYHAVQDVFVHTGFPNVDVAGLVLVDLPGAGEAGVDIDRQFLRDLRDDVDLLLQVKRPDENSLFFTQADFATLGLAETGRGDVRLDDFVVIVVNRDSRTAPDSFANALAKTEDAAAAHGIRTLVCAAVDDEAVRGSLLPTVLDLLADRLERMDAAAIGGVRQRVERDAERVRALADRLAAELRVLRGSLPSGRLGVRALAMRLRKDLGSDLVPVLDDYYALVGKGERCPELDNAVTSAVLQARTWLRDGLDYGDRARWFEEVRRAAVIHRDQAREEQFNRARSAVGLIFERIEASLDTAVARLWGEVVTVLRGRLTDSLVPHTPTDEVALREFLRRLNPAEQPVLTRATTELVDFRNNYGSMFLRICQPVLVQVSSHRRGKTTVREVAEGVGLAVGTVAAVAAGQVPWWMVDQLDAPEAAPVPPTVSHPLGDGSATSFADVTERWTNEMCDELVQVVEGALTKLETALRDEAKAMTRVLAAAAHHFFDGATVTPGVEHELELLCEPIRAHVWPEEFDGAVPAAAQALREAESDTEAVCATAGALASSSRP